MSSSSSPHKGSVKAGQGAAKTGARAITHEPKANSKDGTYRSDAPFRSTAGLRVTLSAVRGITTPGYLTVPFRFQCPPIADLQRDLETPWPSYQTLSLGARSRSQGASLQQWPVSTLFVWDNESFVVWTGTHSHHPNAVNGVFEPQLFIEELEHIAHGNLIFRLVIANPVIWGARTMVSSLANIVSMQPRQPVGEIGTEYMVITFQEFREVTIGESRRSNPNFQAHTYQTKTTDTLYDIARKELGKASDWRRIAAANGIKNVNPSDIGALQDWLLKHHKTSMRVPTVRRHEAKPKTRR